MKKTSSLSDKLNRLNNDPSVLQKPEEKPEKRRVGKRLSKKEPERIAVYEVPEVKKPTEEEQEDILLTKALDEEKARIRTEKLMNFFHAVLILACIYVVFLIYGILVTTYEYNSNGVAEPQRIHREDIAAKKDYENVYYYYEGCRGLYESTLLLDYRLGAGVEDPLAIAPEYESLLDTVETLSIKTDALSVKTGYSQVKSMMLSWIQNDIAVYLQNMSAAISQNDAETANNALQDKDRVYNDFMLITQNMAVLGENIRGVDLTSIKHWTPETYINEEINGEAS